LAWSLAPLASICLIGAGESSVSIRGSAGSRV